MTEVDEGLYMCKSLSPKTVQMAYQVRVIRKCVNGRAILCNEALFFFVESLDITPKQVLIPANESGVYSIRLHCILTDNQTGRRHHEVHWWHNNKRLGSHSNRHARITKNFTNHQFISTLFYTGEPANIAGDYMCESDPLRRYISVGLTPNQASSMSKGFLFMDEIVIDLFSRFIHPSLLVFYHRVRSLACWMREISTTLHDVIPVKFFV